MSNEQRLIDEGLLHEDHELADHELNLLDQLTSEEIDALVSVKAKVGGDLLDKGSREESHPPTQGFAF